MRTTEEIYANYLHWKNRKWYPEREHNAKIRKIEKWFNKWYEYSWNNKPNIKEIKEIKKILKK